MKQATNCNLLKDKIFDVYCGRGKGSKNDPLNCSIGENGWLGNPIAKGKKCMICAKIHSKGGDTLPCYEIYLIDRLKDDSFRKAFYELRGKKLACFCKPAPCHTDIILKYLNEKIIVF